MTMKSTLQTLIGASLLAGAVFTMAPASAANSADCVSAPFLSACVNVQAGNSGSGSGGSGGSGGGGSVGVSGGGLVSADVIDALQAAIQEVTRSLVHLLPARPK